MSQEVIGRSGMRNETKERGLVLWDREACREQETAALVELIFPTAPHYLAHSSTLAPWIKVKVGYNYSVFASGQSTDEPGW